MSSIESSPLTTGPRHGRVTYGWMIVGACVLSTALTSPGQSFAMALYFDALVEELGSTRLGVSMLYGWATLGAAVLLPFAGRLADRWPSRRYLATVLGCAGVALLFLATVRSMAALFIAFFALRFLCQGAVSLGTLTTVVRWFRRRRARALAIVALGYSLGELLFPGLIIRLQENHGWRGSLVVLGAAYLLIVVPLVLVFMREPRNEERPEYTDDAGSPSRLEPPRTLVRGSEPAAMRVEEAGDTLSRALRRPRFWVLLVSMMVPPLVMTGVLIHQVAMFRDAGWPMESVPAALRMFAVAGIVSIYATGMLLERIPAKYGISLSMCVMAVALAVPLLVPGLQGSVLLYGALLGMAGGIAGTTNEVIWPEYHGVTAIGSIRGFVSMGRNGATAAAAPIFALLSGEAAVYGTALLGAVALCLLAAFTGLLLPRVSAPALVFEPAERAAGEEASTAGR